MSPAGATTEAGARVWRGLDLSNPLLIFAVSWAVVLWLVSLQLTTQLHALNARTFLLVGATIVTCAALYLPLSALFPRGDTATARLADESVLDRLDRLVRQLLLLWSVGTVLEIAVAGGVPLLWIAQGRTDVDYRDFGVPTFHGLMMALFFFCVTALYLAYLVRGGRRTLAVLLALLTWPVIMVNRGALMWEVLQVAGVYFLLRPVRLGGLLKVAAAAFVVLVVFGYVGYIRAGASSKAIEYILSDKGKAVFGVLPSGFVWIYVYATAPINNIIAVISDFTPSYSFYYSTSTIFPTVLRQVLFDFGDQKYALGLINEAFNTSTFYINFLADWGVVGAIMCVAAFQALAIYFYLSARRGRVWAILSYTLFFRAIVLSVFADSFTTLVTVAQVVLALYFKAVSAPSREALATEPAGSRTATARAPA